MNNFTGKKDPSQSSDQYYQRDVRPESKGMAFGRGASRSPSRSTTNSTIPLYYDADREAAKMQQRRSNAPPSRDANARYDKALPLPPSSTGYQASSGSYPTPPPVQRKQYRDDGYGGNLLDQSQSPTTTQHDPVDRYYTPAENYEQMPSSPAQAGQATQYQPTTSGSYTQYQAPPQSAGGYSVSNAQAYGGQASASVDQRQQIRASNRKFEYDHGHSGSSSATRRVMDFFRRRGKDRSES
jgi:protein-serine/threonine kinase